MQKLSWVWIMCVCVNVINHVWLLIMWSDQTVHEHDSSLLSLVFDSSFNFCEHLAVVFVYMTYISVSSSDSSSRSWSVCCIWHTSLSVCVTFTWDDEAHDECVCTGVFCSSSVTDDQKHVHSNTCVTALRVSADHYTVWRNFLCFWRNYSVTVYCIFNWTIIVTISP